MKLTNLQTRTWVYQVYLDQEISLVASRCPTIQPEYSVVKYLGRDRNTHRWCIGRQDEFTLSLYLDAGDYVMYRYEHAIMCSYPIQEITQMIKQAVLNYHNKSRSRE